MKTKKRFDCLRMKDAIQAKLREKWRGLTRAEIREEISRFLADSDNSVAVWWRSLSASKKKSS